MPTFFRFLIIVGIIAAAVYGSMIALVTFVQPHQREMSVRVPSDRIRP